MTILLLDWQSDHCIDVLFVLNGSHINPKNKDKMLKNLAICKLTFGQPGTENVFASEQSGYGVVNP